GLLFSLGPLVEIFKADIGPSLQRQGRSSPGAVRYGTRAALVVIQMALSVVVLTGAGLLARAFMHVQQVDPGFTSQRVLTFRIAVPFQRYRPPAAFNTFSRELQRAVAAIPGVTGAGAIS